MTRLLRKYTTFFILICFSPLLSSCGGGGGGSGERSREQLRFVHAAPSLGAATLLQDGRPIISGISYGKASDYVDIDESVEGVTTVFSIRITPEFIVPTLAVTESVTTPYIKTVILTETAGVPELTFLEDATTSATTEGESTIRFINANAAQPTVDVYVTPPDTTLTGRIPVLSALAFKGASVSFPVEPGDYRVRIVAPPTAGTTATETSGSSTTTIKPIFDSNTYAIEGDEQLSFYFLEKRGGGKPYTSLTIRKSDQP